MNNFIRGRARSSWRGVQSTCQLLGWLVLLESLAVAGPSASAQGKTPSSDYQQLIDRGLAAYQAQRPAEARNLFAQAHALQPGARTLRALGIADLALDNFTMAKEELEAALTERALALTDSQRTEVHDLLRWMQNNLGTLHLTFSPLHAEAKIDGRTVKEPEVLLAPEEHQLSISAPGFVPQERAFTVTIDRPMRLSVALERAPTKVAPLAMQDLAEVAQQQPTTTTPQQESSSKLWPWIGGAGAVLLVAGGTMFAFGMNDKATVENAQAPVRLSEIEAAHDRAPWLTGIGLSLGAVGLAGLGTAAILLLTQREPRADAPLTLNAGPTHLSVTGHF